MTTRHETTRQFLGNMTTGTLMRIMAALEDEIGNKSGLETYQQSAVLWLCEGLVKDRNG